MLIERPQAIDDGRSRSLDLKLIDESAAGVENAQQRLFAVNIESEVKHARLLLWFETIPTLGIDLAIA